MTHLSRSKHTLLAGTAVVLLGLCTLVGSAFWLSGCDSKKSFTPTDVSEPGSPTKEVSTVDPVQAILGTWILDNASMRRNMLADPQLASMQPAARAQMLEMIDQMVGVCTFDEKTISLQLDLPGQATEPEVGKYKIRDIEGKNLKIVMTDEDGVDDTASAVLDGDQLRVTFDGESMEFIRKK